jgi:hypothetical protein
MSKKKFLIQCNCCDWPAIEYVEGFEWRVSDGGSMDSYTLWTADKARALAFENHNAAAEYIKKEYSEFMAQGLLIVEVYV